MRPELPFDKLVGSADQIPKLREKLEAAHAKGGELIKKLEVEKTGQEIEIIRIANSAVEEFLRSYGREKSSPIPLSHIHVLEYGGVNKITRGRIEIGANSTLQGSVIVDRRRSAVEFALVVFHELFQRKCYHAAQMTLHGEPHDYRSGASVVTRDGKLEFMKVIEEAVAGYITGKFFRSLELHPLFTEEVSRDKRKLEQFLSRQEEMEEMNRMVDFIMEKNPGKFQNRDDVINLIIRAQVTGNIMPFLRLFEQTSGRGTIKTIKRQAKEKYKRRFESE